MSQNLYNPDCSIKENPFWTCPCVDHDKTAHELAMPVKKHNNKDIVSLRNYHHFYKTHELHKKRKKKKKEEEA